MNRREQTVEFERLASGDVLPVLAIPVTIKSIVTSAIATRDFHPVHHDSAFARATGAPDIFMNILATNGYVERFVREWAGQEARIRSISIRLGVPNYPGDVMRMTGVVSHLADDGGRWVDVAVRGENERGTHVTGSVRIDWG